MEIGKEIGKIGKKEKLLTSYEQLLQGISGKGHERVHTRMLSREGRVCSRECVRVYACAGGRGILCARKRKAG